MSGTVFGLLALIAWMWVVGAVFVGYAMEISNETKRVRLRAAFWPIYPFILVLGL